MATDSARPGQSPQPRFSCREGGPVLYPKVRPWIVLAPQGFPFCVMHDEVGQTENAETRAKALVGILNIYCDKIAAKTGGAR